MTSMLLVTAAVAAALAPARADLIIGNLPASNDLGFMSYLVGDPDGAGMGFAMNEGRNFYLDSVTLRLNVGAGGNPDLVIMDSIGGIPQHVLTTFQNPVFDAGIAMDYSFTPAAPMMLQGGASYWIFLHNNNSPAALTWFSSSPRQIPTGPYASHLGARWTVRGGEVVDFVGSYQISATVVPEPGTFALLVVGTAGLAGLRWMKRRRNPHPVCGFDAEAD